MALVVYDRVQETTTTTGTGSVTLLGAVAGFQSFAVVGNGNTTFYCIADQGGGTNWEVGIGTYSTTGPTLARTTVLASSNSGALVPFTAGTKSVFVTYPAEKSVNLDASGNVTALGTITSGVWNGTTIPVAYGGTGVTASSGANSVVLRDSNQNVTANNFLNGYTAVTAAGGTTTLTAASAYYQRLSGSTTQTFKLPDATTCVLGQAFVFDNDSSGTLTVVDNASAVVDTIPSGGYGYIFAESVSTSAGSWGKYALLPGNYDFNTTTADFGTATITNATYNGNTIGSAYGGTGLTTFTAANNALYSTSSSALTAGTLPVAAGGTGATTFTANGVTYGNGTSALQVTAAGTTGQVLVGNTGAAPSWSTISSSLVSSFSAGTTGFTPSTATTGAVTLAGTLNVANGGTGATTLTGYVYGNGTSAMTASTTIPTSALSGTVGISQGGTGQTTASAAFNALSPITTTGDLIIGNGVNSATRLGIGSNTYVLTSNGTTATWAAPAGSTSLTTTSFTATAGQTTFSVTYTPALLQGVYRNGIKLDPADYTATNGTSVVLSTGAIVGDNIQIQYFTALATSTAVNSISFGSTGLTPSTASTGNVTVAGTLAVANGGTGQTTANAAFNALAPSQTSNSGKYLTTDGTNTSWATVSSGISVTNDTTTATSLYPTFTSATTGSISGVSVTSTKLTFVPSTGTLTATSMVSSSDERLKTNWRNVPANFVDRLADVKSGIFDRIDFDTTDVGVSAQSLQELLPEAVVSDQKGYLGVNYGNTALLAAIELAKEVKELRAEIKALKAELNK